MNRKSSSPSCRLCGDFTSEAEAVNIFQESNSILKFLIRVRLQVDIVSIGQYSNLVCPSCVNCLENFHAFSRKCYLNQIQLARILNFKNTDIEGERTFGEIKSKSEDINSVWKQSRIEVTAENCDSLIIPGRTITAENCDNIIILERTLCENGDEVHHVGKPEPNSNQNHHENLNDISSLKVSLNSWESFIRPGIRCKQNRCVDFENVPWTSPSSDFNTADQNNPKVDINFDENKRCAVKFKKRIPPRVNADDVKCPYCRWFIPREEFDPYHLSLHIKNLDSEFHMLVMADNKKFSNEDTLAAISSHFCCNECDRSFPKRLDLLEHRFIHEHKRMIACHICSHVFGNRKRLRAHLCSIHLEKSFACEKCAYRSKNKPDMRKHQFVVHTNARIQCPACGKLIAAYPHNLKKHMQVHNEVPEYRCDVCPSAFKTKASLRKHRENKHYPIPTMCSSCGTLCASQQKYSKHLVRCKKGKEKIDVVK